MPSDRYTYLCINSKFWLPRIRRDNLAYTIFRSLRCNLFHILERVLELFLRRFVRRCLLQTMWPDSLRSLSTRRWLSPPLHAGQIQRQRFHCAQRQRRRSGIRRGSVYRRFSASGSRCAGCSTGGRGSHRGARGSCGHRYLYHRDGGMQRM